MQPIQYIQNKGVALVISLIILLVVSLLSVTGITNAKAELKLASATKNRAKTFEAAEAALKAIETQFLAEGGAAAPKSSRFACNTADASACPTSHCENGWCFDGLYDGIDPEVCNVVNPESPRLKNAYKDYWADDALWSATASLLKKTPSYAQYTHDTITVKYIVEFLCVGFKTPPSIEVAMPKNVQNRNNNLASIYRITAYSLGPTGFSNLKLQTVVKLDFQ